MAELPTGEQDASSLLGGLPIAPASHGQLSRPTRYPMRLSLDEEVDDVPVPGPGSGPNRLDGRSSDDTGNPVYQASRSSLAVPQVRHSRTLFHQEPSRMPVNGISDKESVYGDDGANPEVHAHTPVSAQTQALTPTCTSPADDISSIRSVRGTHTPSIRDSEHVIPIRDTPEASTGPYSGGSEQSAASRGRRRHRLLLWFRHHSPWVPWSRRNREAGPAAIAAVNQTSL